MRIAIYMGSGHPTKKMRRPWSQQARLLKPRMGNSRASKELGLLCSQTVPDQFPVRVFTFTRGIYRIAPSAFSRRSRCGLSSLLSLLTCSTVPVPAESDPKSSKKESRSSNFDSSRKLSTDQSSETWFWSGVPVSTRRRVARSSRMASASLEFRFLSLWPSSTIR